MTNLLLLGFLPSGSEWIIIAVIILLLFGGKKIPELMKGLGKGVKSFKEGVNEAKEEINKIIIESEDFEELNTLRELAQKVIDHIPSKIENSTSEKLIDFLNEYKTYLISLSDYYKEVTNVLSLFNK